jgi:arylformamidase
MNWQSFDLATLEREYSPSSMIGGNYQPFIDAYTTQSRQAFATLVCRRDLRYGPSPRAWLDYFPAAQADAQLLVFIHGGYWQELSKTESAFLAPAWVNPSRAHCVLDYDLAPKVSVETILAQCAAALKWLIDHAGELGFDPAKIVIAGSSAGAHLAAMLCLKNPQIKGAILLSGIYDLEPLVPTYVNQALGLDEARARALSPLHLLDPAAASSSSASNPTTQQHFPQCLIAWGEHETLEFKRQSREFAALLVARGKMCETMEVPGRNHFDLASTLGDASSELFARAELSFRDQGPSSGPSDLK